MTKARNKAMTERNNCLLNDIKFLEKCSDMVYRVRLFAFKTIAVSQSGDDILSVFSHFLAQAGNVHVDGAV